MAVAKNIDLTVKKFVIGKTSIKVDEDLTLSFDIENLRDGSAASFLVGIYDGETSVGTMEISSLAGKTSISEEYVVKAGTLAAGSHNLTVHVDCMNNVEEINESNNISESKAVDVTAPTKADLTIENFQLDKSEINACEDLTLSFDIVNLGDLSAEESFVVGIYDGDKAIGSMDVAGLAGHGSISEEYVIKAGTLDAGDHNLTVHVDCMDVVDESNEYNNISENKVASVIALAKSDVDGNGVSDVMFQYTGGDYQIGFWMNGTNTWQGQGVGQPSNWELLGAYDMDQNGKADLVMRGNVTIESNKGAYIGYYKDGDVNNWQNIGYLSNPTDVDWKLAVGNLTGNAGANSIVWHAAELGALGVWTDGTSNWVSLAGGFDSTWTMQGCGDFDGDGKDEVLFSHEGNLYSTNIDQKFAVLGQGVTGWEVRAIGDFSGDGQDDIVLFHSETGSVMKFENGTTYQSLGQLDASDWFIAGSGDYNNDQKDDLLVRQKSTGMLGYYDGGDMSKWTEMGRGVDGNWTVIA